jgi:hypothetical protein
MREASARDVRTRASRQATPRPPDAAEMWENLCLADELLDECELLAAARSAEPGNPTEEPSRK